MEGPLRLLLQMKNRGLERPTDLLPGMHSWAATKGDLYIYFFANRDFQTGFVWLQIDILFILAHSCFFLIPLIAGQPGLPLITRIRKGTELETSVQRF